MKQTPLQIKVENKLRQEFRAEWDMRLNRSNNNKKAIFDESSYPIYEMIRDMCWGYFLLGFSQKTKELI